MKLAGESLSSASEVVAPHSLSGNSTVSDQILLQLRQIGKKIDLMDRRLQPTKAALEQGSSHNPLPFISQSQPVHNTVFNSTAMETSVDQSVIPSIEFLRSNESIQCEVEKHLAELRNLNETASKGRLKSQCGGHICQEVC